MTNALNQLLQDIKVISAEADRDLDVLIKSTEKALDEVDKILDKIEEEIKHRRG